MAKIIELSIKKFRGINSFYEKFDRDIICLVGRGDSCKTTVLEAIKYVLSPVWSQNFIDSDFYQLNVTTPIEIEISLIDFPPELIKESSYGLHVRSYCQKTKEIHDDIKEGDVAVLTIKLIVESDLEPKWAVINERYPKEKLISANDRSKLNCFMVSDYVDSHFSWNKGNPLYSLFKNMGGEKDKEKILIDIIREAKAKIDKSEFAHFKDVTNTIQEQAASFGLSLKEIQTTLDCKDINVREGKVSLHLGSIPFRLMGKGSRRLASIAIQTTISKNGGIALIDEIEQGLEPDRVRQVARTLKENNSGQVIITTHSRDVITELAANSLLILHRESGSGKVKSEYLDVDENKLQGVIRACPEAFFAKKVIVCEGATEVGICRAIDSYRIKNDKSAFSYKGVAYVDGTGSSFAKRAWNISKSGLLVSVFCDSDKDKELSPSKEDLKSKNIPIFDCDTGNSIEIQFFMDSPWVAILEVVEFVIETHNKTEISIKESLESKFDSGCNFPKNWKDSDTKEMREALARSSVVKKKEWFKRVDHGERLGKIILKHFDLYEESMLKKSIQRLINWIDE